MIDLLEQWFLENWRPEFGAPRPQRLGFVKTASSGAGLPAKERESKIFFFAFHGRASQPFAIVKIPRYARAAAALEREHWTLRAVAGDETLSAAFLKTVPTPLFFGDLGVEKAAVQSVLAGCVVRGAGRAPSRRANALFQKRLAPATRWLRDFTPFATCGPVVFSEAPLHSWFLVPLQRMRQAAAMAGRNVDPLCADILKDADTLADATFNHVRQHGDFTLSNVTYERGACHVVDFEHFGQEKNPLFDVLWFVRSLGITSYGGHVYQAGPVQDALRNAAAHALGDAATPAAMRALYAQALVQLFNRKFDFRPDNQSTMESLLSTFIPELEALRALFAA